ncbi:polymorphic toxin type 44 domain-containing protein [Neobacillus sp. 19]|uniref:polymorphic toxin type 44 domain-containing protein n=1 Tax=Neobacillus sp. 19 TaxID=3394458 RepID=UPI003BF68197
MKNKGKRRSFGNKVALISSALSLGITLVGTNVVFAKQTESPDLSSITLGFNCDNQKSVISIDGNRIIDPDPREYCGELEPTPVPVPTFYPKPTQNPLIIPEETPIPDPYQDSDQDTNPSPETVLEITDIIKANAVSPDGEVLSEEDQQEIIGAIIETLKQANIIKRETQVEIDTDVENRINIYSVPDGTKSTLAQLYQSNLQYANKIKSTYQNLIWDSGLGGAELFRLTAFFELVKTGGPWDLKQYLGYRSTYTFKGTSKTGEYIGNHHFGYMGKAIGLNNEVLKTGAGFEQIRQGNSSWEFINSYFDDPKDTTAIIDGYSDYSDGYKFKTYKGWVYNNGWYYFDSFGNKKTGWQYIGGVLYYLDSTGLMRTGWYSVNRTWYYFNPSGEMQKNWLYVGGKWYYLGTSGAMRTGWQPINGKWYYFDSLGAMKTGWHNDGGAWYYLDSSGAMKTGWLKDGNTWYYLDSSMGAMKTGWQSIGGYWYYFYSSGAMAYSTTIDGYKIGPDGKRL